MNYGLFVVCLVFYVFRNDAYQLSDCVKYPKHHQFYDHHHPPDESLCGRFRKLTNITFSEFVENITAVETKTVIYLRLGDVIQNNVLSAQELWHKPSSYYIKPKSFYTRILSVLHTAAPIHLHGSICHNNHDIQKNVDYVNLVKQFIASYNFTVIDHIWYTCDTMTAKSIDTDFITMASAFAFVPSGGGFSKAIENIVKRRGIVLK